MWIFPPAAAHRTISDLSVLVDRRREHHILVAGYINVLRGYDENRSKYWTARGLSVFVLLALTPSDWSVSGRGPFPVISARSKRTGGLEAERSLATHMLVAVPGRKKVPNGPTAKA